MPWFQRKSEEDKQQEDAAQAERVGSLEAIKAGGIPLAAQRRLDEVRARSGQFFTSDLSVNEFLLTRELGFRPITQVMGSSVYHVGYQWVNSWYGSGELDVVSRAMNEVRTLALGRMEQEAERAGANVVLGVHIDSHPVHEEKIIEYRAIGTAARIENAPATDRVAITNLSGQDFWKLLSAGYWPLGVAAGSTVYHAVPSWFGQSALSGWGSWFNQELTDFTNGLYSARHMVMNRVTSDARSHRGCVGVVGVGIKQHQEEYEVRLGNDQERTDLIFTIHVIGTAIGELTGQGHDLRITAAVPLTP